MYNLFNTLRPPNPTLFKLPCSFRPNNMDTPPHFSRGIILKTQASVLVAGYTGVWKAEKYVCIKFTKCTWYYCKHQKNLSFLNFIQVEFFKEISHGECWKCYFWASRFQNFLEEHAPRPPYKPCAFVTHFQVPHLKIHSAVPHSGVQDSPLCVSIPMG